ncbi:hypothetical protein HD806DRAFT_551756 [Xylariaceae sp. AK1471]|nr:hypothetical protein HD806DRAFT_551756 [Xylariaceae sp. AK1471]
MSAELTNISRCTCGVFESDAALDRHLEEEKYTATVLSHLQERAVSHKKVNKKNDDGFDGKDEVLAKRLAKHKGENGYSCPYRGCSQTFKKTQAFRRHWLAEQKIPEEFCICCPFKTTSRSKWIDHVTEHKDVRSKAKVDYICQRRKEIIEDAEEELANQTPKEECLHYCKKRKVDEISCGSAHAALNDSATLVLDQPCSFSMEETEGSAESVLDAGNSRSDRRIDSDGLYSASTTGLTEESAACDPSEPGHDTVTLRSSEVDGITGQHGPSHVNPDQFSDLRNVPNTSAVNSVDAAMTYHDAEIHGHWVTSDTGKVGTGTVEWDSNGSTSYVGPPIPRPDFHSFPLPQQANTGQALLSTEGAGMGTMTNSYSSQTAHPNSLGHPLSSHMGNLYGSTNLGVAPILDAWGYPPRSYIS